MEKKMMEMSAKSVLTAIVLFIAYPGNTQAIKLVQNSTSNYQIVIPSTATDVEQKAANQLQEFVNKTTKVSLPIVSEASAKSSYQIQVGSTEASIKNQITKGVKDDGFAIVCKGNTIYISGNKGKGTLYGTTCFLEKFFGVDYLSAVVVTVPDLTKVTISQKLNIISNPAFITRDNFTDMGFNGKWNNTLKDYSGGYKDWHCINHVFSDWDKESEWGNFAHTFFVLVPPGTYFKTHPEYYSLVDGQRQPQQLNLSNPDVLTIVVQNLGNLVKNNPSKKYWMVGQEDVGKFCECADCQKAYAKYGGKQSGLMVEFINKVAQNFPDKQIATFAYHETEAPPQNIKPAANVIIVSAPINAHHNAPLNSRENSQWGGYLKQWSTICNNQMIWDYYADFTDILIPYPNLAAMSPNFKFYKSVGIRHVFAQRPVFMPGSEMEELKAYVISKLLWNPSLNQDSLVKSFVQKYYGDAGTYIVQYLAALTTNLQKTNAVLLTQQDAIIHVSSFLSPAYLLQYNQILDKAANAVKSNQELTNRVNNVRFALDYYVVKVMRNKGQNILSNLSEPVKDQLKQRFKNTVQRLHVKFTADASQQSIEPYLNTLSSGSEIKKTTVASVAAAGSISAVYITRKRRKQKKNCGITFYFCAHYQIKHEKSNSECVSFC